jgi:hypothetical protein
MIRSRSFAAPLGLFVSGTNLALGPEALDALTSGLQNTAIGYQALSAHTSDTYSAAFGYAALTLSTGHANTGFGAGAGGSFTTTYDSIAIGADAGRNADGSGNMTGDNNVLVGVHAGGHITSGRFNNFFGNYSGVGGGHYEGFPSALLTGSYNVGVGHLSLGGIQGDANENVAVGYSALLAMTTGDMNIGIGPYAGRNTTTGSSNIMIGRDVQATSVTASSELNIGNLIRAANLNQGGAVSTGYVGIGVPLNVNPSAPLHIYNLTQAGILLDVSGGIEGAINQQTDGVLNIIPDATGYLNVDGNMTVEDALTVGPNAVPATFKTNTSGGSLFFYAANASGPNATFGYLASRGTVASPSASVSGDTLATPLLVKGYDGNSYESAAQIVVGVADTVSNGVVPGYMLMQTADASGVMTTGLTIDQLQRVRVTSGKQFWLGNAYAGGAPTATGYLTIYDVNGVAYKVPAVAA